MCVVTSKTMQKDITNKSLEKLKWNTKFLYPKGNKKMGQDYKKEMGQMEHK